MAKNRPRPPEAVVQAVRARYGRAVWLTRPGTAGGWEVRIEGALPSLNRACHVGEDGVLLFDSTPADHRRRELRAAARIEAAGMARTAERIRSAVAPEMVGDEVALRVLIATTRRAAALRELLHAAGIRSRWHRRVPKGAETALPGLDVGKSHIRVWEGEGGQPTYEVTLPDGKVTETQHLPEVLALVG